MKKPYKNPVPGDKVEILINGKKESGILLESHERGVLLLKLDNGYNVGFHKEDISEIKIIENAKKEIDKKNIIPSKNKPLIHFYLTGGTISSKLDPKTGGVKDLTEPKEFFSVYPEIFDIANIEIKVPFTKFSENMNPADWIKLAKLVSKSLNDPNVRGVIISHGTDTLHYTGSALSFMLGKLNKPVVLTYAQKSSDRGSSDSRLNLICAANAALSDIAEVLIVGHATTNDSYCYALQANKTRKMHSSRRDAFKSINSKPFAKIFNDQIEVLRDYNKSNSSKIKADAVFDNRIALIKFYPGQDPDIINYYRKKGYRGIIIEMSGLGHVAVEGKYNFIPTLKNNIKKGMFIYAVPQTLYGRVDPYVYSTGRELEEIGVVFLEDLLPETAFVKLGWVIAHKEWRGSVSTKIKMLENINNEFNKRIEE